MINYTKTRLGFTLIETIVSITILAIAIIGPMTLSAQSIRASRDSRLHLEAIHLAEEGVEIIHNMRDNESAEDTSLSRDDWMTNNIFNPCLDASGCIVDATEPKSGPVWGTQTTSGFSGSNQVVRYDPVNGLYSQSNGAGGGVVASPFSRRITMTAVNARQSRIVSVVWYQSTYGNVTRYATATDDIYNWYPCTSGCPP